MYDPPVSGEEYVELCNAGAEAVDLRWWLLMAGQESYHLPHGTMLGTNEFLVIADTQAGLTNSFTELADPGQMVPRFPGVLLWDWPIVWTSAVEYATRIVEIPGLTLPNQGATLTLMTPPGQVIDTLTYSNRPPWPVTAGASIELEDPHWNNATGAAWQACLIVGTPGYPNAAASDRDGDGMNDSWEQQIVDYSGGDAITSVWNVLPEADFDGDGAPNLSEFVGGLNPTSNDAAQLALDIRRRTAGGLIVDMATRAVTGTAYTLYGGRLYTLDRSPVIKGPSWAGVSNFIDRAGTGTPLSYTNPVPGTSAVYRSRIRLQPRR
jgi:hypothetical protein